MVHKPGSACVQVVYFQWGLKLKDSALICGVSCTNVYIVQSLHHFSKIIQTSEIFILNVDLKRKTKYIANIEICVFWKVNIFTR